MSKDDNPDHIDADEPSSWLAAIELQYERALRADRMFVFEVHCFAMALRNLLRTIRISRADSQVREALVEFDQSIPHAVKVRDILEHWDEYVAGSGRLQTGGVVPSSPFAVIYQQGVPIVAFLGDGDQLLRDIRALSDGRYPSERTVYLDLGQATQAARRLVERVET